MSARDEAIKKIKELEDKYSDDGYIFRGTTEQFSTKEGEGKIRDGINSTLYRSLAGREDLKKIFTDNKEIFLAVIEEEISENALKMSPNIMRKHDALTVVQHFGGNTKNIDFSYNIHIALFFACQEKFSTSGELIILHKDKDKLSLEKEGIKITDAANTQDSRSRVSFQESVFARSEVGYIAPELCKIEEIDKDLKEPILEYLWEEKKINRNAVYGNLDILVKDQENIESATPYFEEGLAYQNKREHKKAIACYDKGLKISPNVPAAYNNRANSHMALGEYDLAIEDINKAISFNLNDAKAYNGRGVIYKKLRKYDCAIEDYSRAIELEPDYATAYNNRGNAYSASGRYNLAIEDYSKAISINPNHAEAYYYRALQKHEKGDMKGAKNDFFKAIRRGLISLAQKEFFQVLPLF